MTNHGMPNSQGQNADFCHWAVSSISDNLCFSLLTTYVVYYNHSSVAATHPAVTNFVQKLWLSRYQAGSMHVTSGQHMSTPVAGNTLSNGLTIRTLSAMRSMFLHVVRSCRPLAFLMQKWKWSTYTACAASAVTHGALYDQLIPWPMHTLERGTEKS